MGIQENQSRAEGGKQRADGRAVSWWRATNLAKASPFIAYPAQLTNFWILTIVPPIPVLPPPIGARPCHLFTRSR